MIGVLGVIAVILLFFVFVIGPKSDKPKNNTQEPLKLSSIADKNSSVSMTTYGNLVGDDTRRAIKLTITPRERRLEVLDGYEKTIGSVQVFDNNQEAYINFLQGLEVAGFTNTRKSSISDPRGLCPTGNRFSYIATIDGEDKQDLWSVSCDSSGTFAGRASTVQQLFRSQFTNYDSLVQDVRL